MDTCPPSLHDCPGPDGSLSLKATLGHIAYWEDFTVTFFLCKLDRKSCLPPPPLDFERLSREATAALQERTFREVAECYFKTTNAILALLRDRWAELSHVDQQKLWVPLQHRRQHRLLLEKTLVGLKAGFDGESKTMSA